MIRTDGFVENSVTIVINIRWDRTQDRLKFIFKHFVISPMSVSLLIPKRCCKTALEYKPLTENLKPQGNGFVIEFAQHFLLFVFGVFHFWRIPLFYCTRRYVCTCVHTSRPSRRRPYNTIMHTLQQSPRRTPALNINEPIASNRFPVVIYRFPTNILFARVIRFLVFLFFFISFRRRSFLFFVHLFLSGVIFH